MRGRASAAVFALRATGATGGLPVADGALRAATGPIFGGPGILTRPAGRFPGVPAGEPPRYLYLYEY